MQDLPWVVESYSLEQENVEPENPLSYHNGSVSFVVLSHLSLVQVIGTL